ncbi:hypothetical protein [Candidatus Pantoea multigeneris]|uniref:Uncharacterized protein n=1 Tax=Candidatus Pantoea multigeneris TaxID=2608357 RepID=A0ABX0R7J1_9GAMM|nr:hypothetical protein [Pantoea multigeneris]NIF21331.1 hypothetical protein [Pantoea multigeneris]
MLNLSYLSDNDGTKPSLIINDRVINEIEVLFFHLKNKTGVYVDPYGKTRIYPEHQKILIDALAPFKDKEIFSLIEYLNKAIENDEVIIADGD